ncbi:hypothetical protein D3C83_147180 [compost metagenome]
MAGQNSFGQALDAFGIKRKRLDLICRGLSRDRLGVRARRSANGNGGGGNHSRRLDQIAPINFFHHDLLFEFCSGGWGD